MWKELGSGGAYWWGVPVLWFGLMLVAYYAVSVRINVMLRKISKMTERTPIRTTAMDEIFRMAGTNLGVQVVVVRMRSGYVGEVRSPGVTLASTGPLEVDRPEHVLWDLEWKMKAKTPS